MAKVFLFVFYGLNLFASTFSIECPPTYKQNNFVLRHKVFSSFIVNNQEQCIDKCTMNFKCFSVNYYQEKKQCELNSASHLLNPENLVFSEKGTYIKLKDRSEDTCSDKFCSNDEVCLVDKVTHDYMCGDCNDALGMESGKIPNSSITASSVMGIGHEAWRGRLNNQPAIPYNSSIDSGAWSANVSDYIAYFQIDLGAVCRITQVATQGSPNLVNNYVMRYNLEYSLIENDPFLEYKAANGSLMRFQGNFDGKTVVTNKLPGVLRSRFIRFIPTDWSETMTMRAEIYGCLSET